MKKLVLLLLLVVLVCFKTNAQVYSTEFGKISKAEYDLKQYPEDLEADAVVFFDLGKSYFLQTSKGFEVVFERSTRIKILSESGLKWAEVEIPYYQEGGIYEKVFDIEAHTYNYNDGIIDFKELDISNTYNEKVNNSWNVKKFAIPNVQVGSIIEYRYKVNSQYVFNLRDWEFQWSIPVIYSEYEVKMIPFYEYSWLLQGASRFDSQKSYLASGVDRHYGSITFQDMVHDYVMKDIPAFKSEQFISSRNDYIIKLDFQLCKINYPDGASVNIITTWDAMIKKLLKHSDFGKYLSKAEKLAAKLIQPANPGASETERYNEVIDFVKKNFTWNGDNSHYASKSANKFVEEKHGNSADINLFAIAALNSVGIEAYPVIISTRKNGKIKYDYPFIHFFNYIILEALVDGQKLVADATELNANNFRIPTRCINDKGLVIKKGELEWIGLNCLIPSSIITKIEMDSLSSSLVHSKVSITATEYDALAFRNNYGDDKELIKKEIEEDGYQLIDSTLMIQNMHKVNEPYSISYEQSNRLEIVNNKLYLSPFVDQTMADNPLKQKERTYPIDMIYPIQRSYFSVVTIPKGYQLEYYPQDQKIDNELFALSFSTFLEGQTLMIDFSYSFKSGVYDAGYFENIKNYFDEIVKKGNEKVILIKSESNE